LSEKIGLSKKEVEIKGYSPLVFVDKSAAELYDLSEVLNEFKPKENEQIRTHFSKACKIPEEKIIVKDSKEKGKDWSIVYFADGALSV
jgi:hypothetical protein